MRGGESVVDVDVAELCQFGRESRIVLFFARVVAEVFQERDAARFQGVDDGLRFSADAVIGPADGLLQQRGERLQHRLQAHLGNALALGPVEVRQQHDFRACFRQQLDRRQG